MKTYTKAHAIRDFSDIVAIHFAGVAKTPAELRQAISGFADCMPESVRLTEGEREQVARDNEARQGVKMF